MAQRYEHTGNAVPTSLASGITNASTTINITSGTGWPTGGTGKFWATIDAGTASEEKVLVLSRTGTVLTVTTRGADGTAASSHASGASILHTFSATEADDANLLTTQFTTLGGTPLTTNAVQTVTGKNMTDPSNTFPLQNTIPPGVSVDFRGSSAPAGWLLEDGASYLRAAQPALFAVIGTTYGSVDGTHFNVPDSRGRGSIGAGTGAGLTARTLAATGGTEDAVVPSHGHNHSHTGSSGLQSADHAHSGTTGGVSVNHTHTYDNADRSVQSGSGAVVQQFSAAGRSTGFISSDHGHSFGTGGVNTNHSHTVTVNADNTLTGVSGTGQNMAPYLVATKIIKT